MTNRAPVVVLKSQWGSVLLQHPSPTSSSHVSPLCALLAVKSSVHLEIGLVCSSQKIALFNCWYYLLSGFIGKRTHMIWGSKPFALQNKNIHFPESLEPLRAGLKHPISVVIQPPPQVHVVVLHPSPVDLKEVSEEVIFFAISLTNRFWPELPLFAALVVTSSVHLEYVS